MDLDGEQGTTRMVIVTDRPGSGKHYFCDLQTTAHNVRKAEKT